MNNDQANSTHSAAADWSLDNRRQWQQTRLSAHAARQQRVERQQAEWNAHGATSQLAETPAVDAIPAHDPTARWVWPAAAAMAFGGSAWVTGLAAAETAITLGLLGATAAGLLALHAQRRMAIVQASDAEPSVKWERAMAAGIGLTAGLAVAARHLGGASAKWPALAGGLAIAGLGAGVLLWMASGIHADLKAQWLQRRAEDAHRKATQRVVAAKSILASTNDVVTPAIHAQATAESAAIAGG